jgi:peroxiredoxin
MNWLLFVFGILLPWLLVGLGAWLGIQLLRQNGRLLLRLEAIERRLAQLQPAPAAALPRPAGLPVGAEVPPFALPTLAGEQRTLSDFRGQSVLLIFFSPRCGFCARMAPDLAALPSDGAGGHPVPLVVTTGDPEETRKLVAEHGIGCPVLLEKHGEVSSRYQAGGTPTGYLIDAEGRIASELAIGAAALLALADPTYSAVPHANGKALGGRRPLSESRLQRNGLPAGTPAPGFTVPCLDGGELSLEEYRGRKVLLVFSDPNCGPCNALLPVLEQLSRAPAQLQVVLVSRGEVEANQRKAAEYGLTFPVALQRQWEISRQYGMFATPIAYLIDEEGVIAADVAVGVEAILAMVPGSSAEHEVAAAASNGKAAAPRHVRWPRAGRIAERRES